MVAKIITLVDKLQLGYSLDHPLVLHLELLLLVLYYLVFGISGGGHRIHEHIIMCYACTVKSA